MKIRKIHAKKRYRYNVDRKTLRRLRTSTGNIKDNVLKKHWEDKKSCSRNYNEMGLATNLKKILPVPNFKQQCVETAKAINTTSETEINTGKTTESRKFIPRKAHVTKDLEQKINEAKKWNLRLPKNHVKQLAYFLDKHKLNYKKMAEDKKNHDQWTWKQFRMKIRKFMLIEEQFNEYLSQRKLSSANFLEWPEYASDSD